MTNKPTTVSDQKKLCAFCGREFAPTNDRQKYHSKECKWKANNALAASRRQKNRTPKPCPYCGLEFVSTHGLQKYCSPDCRRKAENALDMIRRHDKTQRPPKACAYCGRDFVPSITKRGPQIYCSPECSRRSASAKSRRRRKEKRDKPKLAVVVTRFLEHHTCHADCPCSTLSHLIPIAREYELKLAAVRGRKSAAMKLRWAQLDPEAYQQWIDAMIAGQTPEVRQQKSASMVLACARPEVKQRHSDGSKKAWELDTTGERRQQVRETFALVLSNPDVEKRRRERFGDLDTREKISAGLKIAWDGAAERRQQTSERTRRFQAELKATIAAAWRPDDWEDDSDKAEKKLDRMTGLLLICNRDIKNLEIGALLDEMGWNCPYGKNWKSALSRSGSAANRITDIRKWVKVPGKTIPPK